MKVAEDQTRNLAETAEPEPARVVYLRPPVELGRLVGRETDGWRVAVGGDERVLPVDPSVQERLLEATLERGGRVLVEHVAAASTIVGAVMTSLPVSVDDAGKVVVEAEEVLIEGKRSVTLTSGGGMVHLKRGDVELYGREVLTRARELARVLARMISLN